MNERYEKFFIKKAKIRNVINMLTWINDILDV